MGGEDKQLTKMLLHLAINYYNDTQKYKLSFECGISKKMVGKEHHLHAAFSIKPRGEPSKANPGPGEVKLPFQMTEESDSILPNLTLNSTLPKKQTGLISEVNSTSRSIKFESEILTEPKECVKMRAKVDFINSISDLDLEVLDGVLVLTVDSFSVSRHKIPQGHRVVEDSARAKLSKSKTLTITFELLP